MVKNSKGGRSSKYKPKKPLEKKHDILLERDQLIYISKLFDCPVNTMKMLYENFLLNEKGLIRFLIYNDFEEILKHPDMGILSIYDIDFALAAKYNIAIKTVSVYRSEVAKILSYSGYEKHREIKENMFHSGVEEFVIDEEEVKKITV